MTENNTSVLIIAALIIERSLVKYLKAPFSAQLYFPYYINDIANDSNFTTRLFADDTVLMLLEKNLSVLNATVNSELHKIQLWLSKNKLS